MKSVRAEVRIVHHFSFSPLCGESVVVAELISANRFQGFRKETCKVWARRHGAKSREQRVYFPWFSIEDTIRRAC